MSIDNEILLNNALATANEIYDLYANIKDANDIISRKDFALTIASREVPISENMESLIIGEIENAQAVNWKRLNELLSGSKSPTADPELTPELCKKLLSEGKKVIELCQMFNMGKSTMYEYLTKNGISPKDYRKAQQPI